jgi:hypothetical protein
MRAALDAWRARVEDWSEASEDAMVARFEPDGRRPQTRAPRAELLGARLVLRPTTAGASLGYRIDGGPWQLYTGPIPVPPGARVEAKAVRYGWIESNVVSPTVIASGGGDPDRVR